METSLETVDRRGAIHLARNKLAQSLACICENSRFDKLEIHQAKCLSRYRINIEKSEMKNPLTNVVYLFHFHIFFSFPHILQKLEINKSKLPNNSLYLLNHRRYKILCINLVKDVPKPEVVAQIILTHLQMPEENYRMGKTKVYLLF